METFTENFHFDINLNNSSSNQTILWSTILWRKSNMTDVALSKLILTKNYFHWQNAQIHFICIWYIAAQSICEFCCVFCSSLVILLVAHSSFFNGWRTLLMYVLIKLTWLFWKRVFLCIDSKINLISSIIIQMKRNFKCAYDAFSENEFHCDVYFSYRFDSCDSCKDFWKSFF